MRILIAVSIASLLVFSGCAVSLHGHGHYRYRAWRHHPHRHHDHWNAAGPAYAEAANITEITILSATLPSKIDGEFNASDEAQWRSEWPLKAAHCVADSLAARSEAKITGTVSTEKPKTGYYMTLEITYLDVGDPRPDADGTPRERGSALTAHGVIINAESGQIVADVKFLESAGWTAENTFAPFMTGVGASLADWFIHKRSL